MRHAGLDGAIGERPVTVVVKELAGMIPTSTARFVADKEIDPAVIVVISPGRGLRGVQREQASRFGDRWGDVAALEAALFEGASRFRDPGRGQGLRGISRYVSRWSGKLSVRSGTARITIVPSWDDDVPVADGLPPFPGSQVVIIIPAQQAE